MDCDLAVVLTLFNRPEPMLRHTLSSLLAAARGGPRSHLVIVDDGSDAAHRLGYQKIRKDLGDISATWVEAPTLVARPKTYHINGHNNPAYCTNRALDLVAELGAPRTLLLSSDVMVRRDALRRVCAYDVSRVVLAKTRDTAQGSVFCSTQVLWPMCWFVCAATEDLVRTRFDEAYLLGMAFEDNDFMGRLLLNAGELTIDDAIQCWHQHHPQTAYSDQCQGFRISERYTQEKWGGVPFRPQASCLTFSLAREEGSVRLHSPVAKELRP